MTGIWTYGYGYQRTEKNTSCVCDLISDASVVQVFTLDNGLVGSQVLKLQSRENETLFQLDQRFLVADVGRQYNFTQTSLRFNWSNPMNESGFVLIGIKGILFLNFNTVF